MSTESTNQETATTTVDAGATVGDAQPTSAMLTMQPQPPSNISTVAFEGFLLHTLLDIQTRSEVEACLNDLVTDVEFAVTLQERLGVVTHQNQAERIIAEQQLALEETHVVQKERLKSETLLADAMVKDLWSLSKEVGSLLELKQKHEAMLLEYDELVAKLAQSEEDLYAARRNHDQAQSQSSKEKTQPQTKAAPQQPQPSPPQAQQPQPAPAPSSQATVVKIPEKKPAHPASDTATVVKIPEKSPPPESASEKPAALKTDPDEAKNKELETAPTTASSVASKEGETSEVAKNEPVVALVTDDQDTGDETTVTLENVEMEILMRIFGFLEAHDILNTAQINVIMYSRVDSMFGFSMDAPGHDDNMSTTSTLATTPTVAAATQNNNVSSTPTTASLSTNTTPAKAAPSTAKPAPYGSAAAAKTDQNQPVFGHRIINLLSGGNAGGPGAPAQRHQQQQSPQRGGGGGAGRGRSGSSDGAEGKPPLSEAMAHSMAAKLNDAEINAIISMTEKLRAKEKQVSLLIKEKEELEGKLSGSEAVKDFLITKVRDMEKIMNRSDETEKKVTQQIASDQEVIAFLDGRVQELERLTRVIQKEKNAAQEKLKSAVAQNDKKVSVLSDMLQFERQKLKENERDWKATKKLLVKEVKGCRAQIVALQAERDGFREQNDGLRKAVMSNSGNGRSSSPHR